MTSQPLGYPLSPAHRPTVAKLTGIKRRERSCRLQLLCFQWFYERTGARHALFQLRTGVEARSAPGIQSLRDSEQFQQSLGRLNGEICLPFFNRLAQAQVAPSRSHCFHAGSLAGLDVAQIVTHIPARFR
jgi:hypothetical protein